MLGTGTGYSLNSYHLFSVCTRQSRCSLRAEICTYATELQRNVHVPQHTIPGHKDLMNYSDNHCFFFSSECLNHSSDLEKTKTVIVRVIHQIFKTNQCLKSDCLNRSSDLKRAVIVWVIHQIFMFAQLVAFFLECLGFPKSCLLDCLIHRDMQDRISSKQMKLFYSTAFLAVGF